MTAEFRITGRHVLAALAAFFLLIVAVNAVFITYAVRTFPGEKEEKSYLQGLNYNDIIDARALQDALGWSATIDALHRDTDGVRLVVSMTGAAGDPLTGLRVTGTLLRPASADGAQSLDFVPLANGRYTALADIAPGAWDLSATAVSQTGDRFTFGNRITAP